MVFGKGLFNVAVSGWDILDHGLDRWKCCQAGRGKILEVGWRGWYSDEGMYIVSRFGIWKSSCGS